MAVYVIAEFETSGPESIRSFRQVGPPKPGRFGEKVLVETGHCETLVGEWMPQRLAVLEFPSMDEARAWWSAIEERARPARMKFVKRNMILVEGLD
jgi:uncharacterized protein (DUF1330 family)